LEGQTVILVDDGLATGTSMRAAVTALREYDPFRIVLAVPMAPPETCAEFEDLVDEVVCVETPALFMGVGGAYRDFSQTTDEEVRELLQKTRQSS
jgi:predicted phosphoribosyltransferase